jgi:hypothetical protein
MKVLALFTLLAASAISAGAQQSPAAGPQSSSKMMDMHHDHAAGAPISYGELKDTVASLERARQATAKYQDVRVAEADGYRAIGPEVPGMGLHFVRTKKDAPVDGSNKAPGFDVERPQILLYENDPSVAGGYALVGVSYLLRAAEGPDGQPLNSPFPKSLASWHRHENICVLPDRRTPTGLTQDQCQQKGGSFTAETQWMVHAWIWKDSPLGVFSPTNPTVR